MRDNYFVVLDFEMCDVKGKAVRKMRGWKNELIQVGAVMLDKDYRIIDDFVSYIKPVYGEIDSFIEELTGITRADVEEAEPLQLVLKRFEKWVGKRDVMILSWSDMDYIQLKREMAAKRLESEFLERILDSWVDFQHSFDNMLGIKKRYALADALAIGRVPLTGRAHDGLCDAYHTARLFMKIQRQSAFQLKLSPICRYLDVERKLCFSMGDLFTPEILAQIPKDLPVKMEEVAADDSMKGGWSMWRKLYRLLKGTQAASDECWNKLVFKMEMRKIDVLERLNPVRRLHTV